MYPDRKMTAKSQAEYERVYNIVKNYTEHEHRIIAWHYSFSRDVKKYRTHEERVLMSTPSGIAAQMENQREFALGNGNIYYIRLIERDVQVIRISLEWE